MTNFKNILFAFAVVLFIFLSACSNNREASDASHKKKIVSVSTFSLFDISKHIASGTLDINMILPFGVDAHSFEPTPKQMTKIMKSDLVIYSGAGLEPWTSSFNFSKKSKIIDMSKYMTLLKSSKHHGENKKHHMPIDPHYWLDIKNMIKATKIITEEFIKLSPKNKKLYEKNEKAYIDMLNSLDEKYKRDLRNCTKDTIVVNHNAFSYMSKNYNFHVEALSGLSPEAQIDAKSIIRIMKHIKEHNVSIIFFESFVSDKAMKSISKDLKVDVDMLEPLGNIREDDYKKSLDYEDIMLRNLKKISKSLECR